LRTTSYRWETAATGHSKTVKGFAGNATQKRQDVRGRKPKPSAVKKLEGNPGKRPLNTEEPTPPVEIPDCPKHITGHAREEWLRASELAKKLGILTALDRSVFSAYCEAWGLWVEACEHLAKEGVLLRPPSAPGEKETLFGLIPAKAVNPAQMAFNNWYHVKNKAWEQFTKLASELGFSPTSRSRVHGSQETDKDESADFLDGKATTHRKAYTN
jgi:P27 family predicted phage terminase small subunit